MICRQCKTSPEAILEPRPGHPFGVGICFECIDANMDRSDRTTGFDHEILDGYDLEGGKKVLSVMDETRLKT